MELKIQDEIGRLEPAYTALYNKQAELVYEAHDELPCEFLSVELLEALEQHFPLQPADVEELISMLKKHGAPGLTSMMKIGSMIRKNFNSW